MKKFLIIISLLILASCTTKKPTLIAKRQVLQQNPMPSLMMLESVGKSPLTNRSFTAYWYDYDTNNTITNFVLSWGSRSGFTYESNWNVGVIPLGGTNTNWFTASITVPRTVTNYFAVLAVNSFGQSGDYSSEFVTNYFVPSPTGVLITLQRSPLIVGPWSNFWSITDSNSNPSSYYRLQINSLSPIP